MDSQTENFQSDNNKPDATPESTSSDAQPETNVETVAPVETAPIEDAAPIETAPVEAAPIEAAPVEAAPVEAAPVETPAPVTTPAPTPSRQPSMAQIMESDEFSSYISGAESLERGALLKGVVVRIDDNTGEMLVDIGTKSEGIIAKNEVGDDEINIGDNIEVVVLRTEDDDGHPVLSKRRADFERRWRELAAIRDANQVIEGTVREQVKGGLIVDLGVSAFVPASHVDARNRGDLSRFVGRTIPVRVIEIDRKKNKVIASHRLAAEEDRKSRESEAWGNLEKDKIVEGVVRRITDFGAFIDLGGVDGLLHVREMAWSRVEHPENVVKKGQKLQVLVLDIDEERKRVALGLKQLQSDPWKKIAKDYKIGQTLTGKIVRIAPSCAFMEIADGVEGIIPISEMSEMRINKPEDVLEVGQEVEARIKQMQTNQRRITLSLRAATVERERRETRTAIREVNERATGGGGGGGNSGGGSGDDGGIRLGDIFGQQLREARDRGRERNEVKAAVRRGARERALIAAEEEDWDGTDTGEAETGETETIETDAVAIEADASAESANIEGTVAEAIGGSTQTSVESSTDEAVADAVEVTADSDENAVTEVDSVDVVEVQASAQDSEEASEESVERTEA